ncbi:uncharacterized protein FSUBG_12003 [Fusarium subglutinans]|uniref:Uncharacterized protein n=1 Tax=Gibberella subglutinans TaxID=42677 RepID=A0A8H5P1T4_GIBSU|nr:uncharacterized protein FSUBG_12003 [Fusarium subglutinans]KAF5586792.1 hypothetical protein FSUBG_12003 [Fusarium subglutinans]
MSSQGSSSSSKDPSNKRSSELMMLSYGASLEHHKFLEDLSSKAYDLGLKAGQGQANLNPDDETQALILSLTDRNDELEKQVKDHATDSLLDLAKEVRDDVSAAYRAVNHATHADCLKPDDYRTLRESCSKLLQLEYKCKERVEQISRGTAKRPGGALERERSNKRPFRG